MKAIVEQSNGIVVSVRYVEDDKPEQGGAPEQGSQPESPKKEKNAKR